MLPAGSRRRRTRQGARGRRVPNVPGCRTRLHIARVSGRGGASHGISCHCFGIKQQHLEPLLKASLSLLRLPFLHAGEERSEPAAAARVRSSHSPARPWTGPGLPRVPEQHLRSGPALSPSRRGRAAVPGPVIRAVPGPVTRAVPAGLRERFPARPRGGQRPPPAPRAAPARPGPCGRGSQRAARRACATGRALLIPLWSGRGDICNWRRRREP